MGCGGQTLVIVVDGVLVQTQSWITQTTSGAFATEDYLTTLEFTSSGEVTPGEYNFSVVATMDDFPAKQVVTSFKLLLANIEMHQIEGVSLEVGDPEISRAFMYRVTPAALGEQLLKTKTVKVKQEDGSLVDLPGFMAFNEDDFSVDIYTDSQQDAGNYTIVVTVDFPDYPGLTLSRQFEVEIKTKETAYNTEIAYWDKT